MTASSSLGWNIERDALRVAGQGRAGALLLVAGLAAIGGLSYLLLWTSLDSPAKVALSLVVVILVVFLALWAPASCLSYFHKRHETGRATVGASVRQGLSRVLPLVPWALAAGLVWSAAIWVGYFVQRRAEREAAEGFWQGAVREFLMWIAWVLIVAFFAHVAVHGWPAWAGRHINRLGAALGRWRSWVVLAVVYVLCGLAPARLLQWTPEVESLGAQTASMVLRFGVAFLLSILGTLFTISLLARLQVAAGGTDSGGESMVNPGE